MTSQGSPQARFRRALEVRSVFQAELAAREMRRVGLLDALDYCALLAVEAPARYERAARRWLIRLLSECDAVTLEEAHLALACLRSLPGGDVEALREVLRALVKRRDRLRGV